MVRMCCNALIESLVLPEGIDHTILQFHKKYGTYYYNMCRQTFISKPVFCIMVKSPAYSNTTANDSSVSIVP